MKVSSSARKSVASSQHLIPAFMRRAPHRVAILLYPGGSAYEVAGIAEILSTANHELRRSFGVDTDAYTLEVISSVSGVMSMEMGIKMVPDRTIDDAPTEAFKSGIDTLLVCGGNWEPVSQAMKDQKLIRWIQRTAAETTRVASLCTGVFLLAQAGVLKGAATTHWAHCSRLSSLFPRLEVKADNIFVKSGQTYSSAGSTAAMDLVLALIEEDMGRKLAMGVARRMVMFLKRPGGQSQFSTALLAQAAETAALKDIPEWIANHLSADLSVDKLAARANMSPRNFARVFLSETGVTPAKYVERARVERARMLMEETQSSLGVIAAKAGFESDRQMRRSFMRWLNVMPSDYVARFRGGAGVNGYVAPASLVNGSKNRSRVQSWATSS